MLLGRRDVVERNAGREIELRKANLAASTSVEGHRSGECRKEDSRKEECRGEISGREGYRDTKLTK